MVFRGTEAHGCLSQGGTLLCFCTPGVSLVGWSAVLDITVLISIPARALGAISYNPWILHMFEMQGPEAEDQFRYHDSDMFVRPLLGSTI